MCTVTRRVQILVVLVPALLLLPPARVSSASRWTGPQAFRVAKGYEPAPRAAIAADGTSAVVWRSKSGGMMLTTGRADGHFSAPRAIDRAGAGDHAVAVRVGGGLLVAWQQRDGLWIATRARSGEAIAVRRVAPGNDEEINGVQVVADPHGGWVVAERRFVDDPQRLFHVHALSLSPDGLALSEPQDLGLGAFGIDGRQALTLAVDDAGRAVLAFDREEPATPFAEQGVLVSTRPPGGAFSAPVTLGARTVGPRVAVGSSGRALVASTALRDAYTYGNPVLVAVGPAGALGAPFGPAVARPRRTFRPSVAFLNGAASVLVFQVAASDGREEAPVHAVAITGDGTIGALQTLTAGLATEPVVLPLLNGRVLAVWRGGQRLGAAIAGPDGDFSRTAAPAGPPPSAYHSSSTNRHFATGGGFAIFAWARELEGRVRVSVRRFTSRGR